ncbi:conserved exported hypothetical protein [Tenacibaculum litopenaei]|uniref:hypothetical protein n=1 Tax=Tenacibaculum litopenaei TaxID=396016 RepID=UPI0038953CC0
MKKVIGFLIFVLSYSTAVQAQRGERAMDEERNPMTVAQQATIAVKKMTLRLNLNNAQQRKIQPLLEAQIADRRAMKEQRKALKKKKAKPTADQRFNAMNARLDKQIEFKRAMMNILDEKQFERFEKTMMRKKMKMTKRIKKEKHKRNRKLRRDRDHRDE